MAYPPGYSKWDLIYVRPDDPTQLEYPMSLWTKTKDDAQAVADRLAEKREDLKSGKYKLIDIRPGKVIITPKSIRVFGQANKINKG